MFNSSFPLRVGEWDPIKKKKTQTIHCKILLKESGCTSSCPLSIRQLIKINKSNINKLNIKGGVKITFRGKKVAEHALLTRIVTHSFYGLPHTDKVYKINKQNN